MKKEIQVLGSFNDDGVFEPTHLIVTKEIAKHKLNKHLELNSDCFLELKRGCTDEQPSDTPTGYYICSGGRWVYVPFT